MSSPDLNPNPISGQSSGLRVVWEKLKQWRDSEFLTGLTRGARWCRRALTQSISARIAFLCAAANSLLLLVTSVSLDFVLQKSLQEDDVVFIRDEINSISQIMRANPGEKEPLRRMVELEGAARRHGRYYVRILDPNGGIFIQSSSMLDQFPAPVDFPRLSATSEKPAIGRRWVARDTRHTYVLGAARAELIGYVRRPMIQVALDVTEEGLMLASFRAWGVLVFGVGTVASLFAGWMIARRGLRPLVDITHRAQSVSATRLSDRIGAKGWPKELKALAQEFDQMLERLEDSFTRLSQFSADLAHELRTPINNLVLGTEVALGRGRSVDEYRLLLESSREEYERLSRMIDSLLFLARADNAEMQVNRVGIDAAREIRNVVEFFQPLAEDKGVSLRGPQSPADSAGPLWLNADSILFRRAINNLVSNALHYTPAGGSVMVDVQKNGNGFTEVTVTDTGCGISREHQPRIFDRFYRVDPARSRNKEGAGLGLAIVKSIVTLHGGNVTVASEEGKGTQFILRFPSAARPRTQAETDGLRQKSA